METVLIDKLLHAVVKQGASDLHITVGQPPVIRHDGHMKKLQTKVLEPADTVSLMKSITPDRCQQELQAVGGSDFGFAFGDKLLFVAHGIVIAGIDMEKLQPTDMSFDGTVLYVNLPPTEIFIATLDNEKSYVYDRDTGLLTQGQVDLETLARQTAEDEIRKAALEDGILLQAQRNAEAYLIKFFSALGFKTVIFPEE